MKTIGASGEIELNDENKISFRVMNEKEDLQRCNKSGEGIGALFELMQIFKRNMNRDIVRLVRRQHKVDISLNFEDKASGIRAALWGDYYIHMLDSNSVNTNNLYEQDSNGNYLCKKAEYKKKTFGIWNIMVQKDFGKDMSAYIGIDNLFNHRDDDRAYQDRLYRIGANIKFGWNGKAKAATAASASTSENGELVAADSPTAEEGTADAKKTGDWLLNRPSDNWPPDRTHGRDGLLVRQGIRWYPRDLDRG